MKLNEPYNRKSLNCAHYVAEFFNAPTPDDEYSFIRWMRKNFKPICEPERNCLVVVGPPLHVGIYIDNSVKHMQNDQSGGQLSIMELAMFTALYKNVRFFKCLY